MASAAAMCRSVLRSQSQAPLEMGSGKRCLSLDGWVCQPSGRPVSTASSTSSSGSSCTTEKGMSHAKSLALDVSCNEEEEACSREVRCETPKSKKHRIPVVDVDLCPPAPKKPRASGRLSVLCSAEREGSNLFHKLGFSPSYLF
ncbi:hypothetical protein M758_12G188000 [Ceratodon purpureus]|nr:hypothetical protein M758_12G188000 [Ceratodon purpureus]